MLYDREVKTSHKNVNWHLCIIIKNDVSTCICILCLCMLMCRYALV